MGSYFTERTSQRPKNGLCGPTQSAPLPLTSTPLTLQPSHTYSLLQPLDHLGVLEYPDAPSGPRRELANVKVHAPSTVQVVTGKPLPGPGRTSRDSIPQSPRTEQGAM